MNHLLRSISNLYLTVLLVVCCLSSSVLPAQEASQRYFEIQFVDAETQRGLPLIQLTTTTGVRYVTDNAGRVAYFEPNHAGETVFFELETHGYEAPKDGLGIKGGRVKIKPGTKQVVPLKRINLAERLYRITGEGLYRDSVLLGYETPLQHPLGSAKVIGQDSVQAALYQKQIHWFWGDTSRISYPLGLFRTAGAVSPLPANAAIPHQTGIDLDYFTKKDGFARAMVELEEKEGVVWIDGLCTVRDGGKEKMVAHYSRRKGLAEQLAHGIVVYDDSRNLFVKAVELPETATWQHLSNHPITAIHDEREYLQSGTPFPLTRVPANYEDLLAPEKYESWTCLADDANPRAAEPLRDATGNLDYRWRKAPPVTPRIEARWLRQGIIRPEEAILSPADANNLSRRVQIHTGCVYWNDFRKSWIMLASEFATDKSAPSHLGEIWYSEGPTPQGPFNIAVKILTHNKQSFYNVCHHPFLNESSGRIIYFEGTYTHMFTSAPATPRHNYNQIMYRFDLENPEINRVFGRRDFETH